MDKTIRKMITVKAINAMAISLRIVVDVVLSPHKGTSSPKTEQNVT